MADRDNLNQAMATQTIRLGFVENITKYRISPSSLTEVGFNEQLALWSIQKQLNTTEILYKFPVLRHNQKRLSSSFKEHIMGLMGIKRFRFEMVMVQSRAIVEVSSCQFW